MDVLSEVLKVVKLQGALFYNGEFSSPWSFCSPHSRTVAPYVAPGARHVIIYHLLTEGRASARLVDGQRIILEAGDIVIFPHGDAHASKAALRRSLWTWSRNWPESFPRA
jgi:cupin